MDELRETVGHWILKEEALDRTLWRTRSGRGYGPDYIHIYATVPNCILYAFSQANHNRNTGYTIRADNISYSVHTHMKVTENVMIFINNHEVAYI